MSSALLEKEATDAYVRIVCPSNQRASLQKFLHMTADVIEDQVVKMDGDYNVVTVKYPNSAIAISQSSRISGLGMSSDLFDSLEASLDLPESLQTNYRTVLPFSGNNTYTSSKSKCNRYIESAQSLCVLKPQHRGACRSKTK